MKKRKFLAVLLALVLTLSLLPTVALAEASETLPAGTVASLSNDQDGINYYCFDSLADAVKKAKSGDTIKMWADFVNADLSNSTNFSLKDGVTLDGQGHEIRGNASVYMSTATGTSSTVNNVVFKYIHNGSMASQSDCDWYGWENGKQGTKSAIYASNLYGEVNITNCVFDNADWDAIQITPYSSATINITGNTFSHSSTTDYSQLRYIHMEGKSSSAATVNVTGNRFYKTKNPNADTICNIGIWYIKATNMTLTGNYFEYDPADKKVCTNSEVQYGGIASLFPALAAEDATTATLVPVSYIGDIAYLDLNTAPAAYDFDGTTYATLQNAIDNCPKSYFYLAKDCSEEATIPAGKSFGIYTKTYKMNGTITNNGTMEFTSGSNTDSAGTIINNGTLQLGFNAATGCSVTNNGTLKITYGDTYDLNKITGAGTVAITGGTFTTKPNDAWIAFGYIASSADDAYTVGLMNDEQAAAAGAVARYYPSTSTSRRYYKTVQEGIQNGSLHLLANVNENVTKDGTIYLYCDDYKFTGSLSCPGNSLYIYSGTAILNNIECGTFYGGYSSYAANVTVKSGTATAIKVAKNATVRIEGGTYTGAITVTSGGTGSLTITGGTFSSNPSEFVPASCSVTANQDGTFTVACAHTGTLNAHAAVPADCTNDGTKAYWECTNCHKLFSDALGTTEIAAPETVTAAGHSFGDWTVTKEPTTTEAGSKTRECSVCHIEETEAIPVLGTYAITANVTNGTVTAAPNPAAKGQTVTLTLTPKDGYNDADVQLYYSYGDVVNAEIPRANITVGGTEVFLFRMPDASVTITGTFKPIEYQITYNLDGGTQSASNPNPIKYTVESDTITLSAPTRSGYTFLGWTYEGQTAPSKNVTIPTGSIGDKTFTANWSYNGGGSTGGGGGSSSGGSSSSTTTEKNPDGSTTTTTTDKTTGTVTETTKNTDGSTTTVETKKDGTVTETNKAADGTTGTVVTDKNGDVTEAKATVSTKAATEAAKTGEAVTLPVEVPAAKTTETAPTVEVTVPKSAGSVKVEIPVETVTPGTVAVIVNADGTEKIVSTSVVTENGVALTLEGNATVKVIDNSKSFTDVPETNVFYNEISSLSAREIMVGKTEDTFDLHNDVTLNQVANVAGRITGVVDVKDFNAGIVWGNENGLKTGNEAATRGEVLKALYVAAGSPAVADTSVLARFNDAASIPADMADIVAWAAQNGILKGTDAGNADLNVYVTRGQACALASRTMGTLV